MRGKTGYWGKFKTLDEDGEPRLIWVDVKMSRDEMKDFDDTLRHNFAEELSSDMLVYSVEEYWELMRLKENES